MAWYDVFDRKNRLITAIAYILLEIALLFHFYVKWRVSQSVNGSEDGWGNISYISPYLVLGISIAMVLCMGIRMITSWLSLHRYALNAAIWLGVFFLSTLLFQWIFGLSNNEGLGIFIQMAPTVLWTSIFIAGLNGFLNALKGGTKGDQQADQTNLSSGKDVFYEKKRNYLWFSLAALLAILAEGACRVLYFLANRAVVLNGDTDFFSWASRMGTVMDGVFLDVCKVTLACLAVLLFYREMKLSAYLLGNLLFYGELCIVLPVLQWTLNPMFVKNVFFSIGLSLIGTAKIIGITLLFYLIACLLQKRRRKSAGE